MKNFLYCIIFVFSGLLAQAQSGVPAVLTNIGVIDMHKSGLGNEVILASINTSKCKFNVTAPGLVALKKAGIDDSVITRMIEKQAEKDTPSQATASIATNDSRGKLSRTGSTTNVGINLPLLNHVYYGKSASETQPLEKTVVGIRTKSSPIGSKVLYQVDGAKSATRLTSGPEGSFLINTGSDALPELVLYSLAVVKGKREVVTMKATPAGLKTGESVITISTSKESNGLFKVTPSRKLESGEYFFTGKPVQGSTSADAFTFGID